MVKYAVVNSKELGSNCWLAERFVEGGRCPRVMQCKYPEKKNCKAVDAEIAHLRQRRREIIERTYVKITQLIVERS